VPEAMIMVNDEENGIFLSIVIYPVIQKVLFYRILLHHTLSDVDETLTAFEAM
jgi:hypothetical protein